MTDTVATILVVAGTIFMLLSAVGVLRMPDVYMRLAVATKASSLGAGCLMLGVALHFEDFGIVVRAILVVIFIFLTAPVSAHLIGRAAYVTGVKLWAGSGIDELRDAYHPTLGTLKGRLRGSPRDGTPGAVTREASGAHKDAEAPGPGAFDSDPEASPIRMKREHSSSPQ